MTRYAWLLAAACLAAACSSSPENATITVGPGIEMIRIDAGRFTMGTPEGEAGRENQERLHAVRLTTPFYLGVTEVTQAQWEAAMGTRPSHFGDCGGDCPVERVNYHDVQAFIARLNATAGGGFRLPTEAEWEYACRAGGRAPFGHTSTLGSADANINGAYPYGADATGPSAGTQAAASFDPNPWGLFDMSGNVWEWVEDRHCSYPADGVEVVDPIGRCESAYRVIRGGSWAFDGNSARCGLRYTHRPQDLGFSLGFRLARSVR
jgi:formylglycine-generating enzyme required for sulfatase activity